MYILKNVYKQIQATIGTLLPESGGIIAIDRNHCIAGFFFDEKAAFGKPSYVPSTIIIQEYVRENWSNGELSFCGIVHSHPVCNVCEPSYIDIEMARKIMLVNNMKELFLLMVRDKEIKLFTVSNNDCKEIKLEIAF